MSIAQMVLPEFDQEMATTRRVIERVPDDRLSWQPHVRSMTMGRLAGHLAELVGWGVVTFSADHFDFAPTDGQGGYVPFEPKSRQEILDLFDENYKKSHAIIEKTDDAEFMKPWTLRAGERVIFTMPRAAVLRAMTINHVIHHRGQLSVYLRLNDVPVPSIYGPSADEQ